MQKVKIKISGIGAELVLGNYMPADPAIMKNWEDFFYYNDLLHESLLLREHIEQVEILLDDETVFCGKPAMSAFKAEKSFMPVMFEKSLYLRTECVEKAVFEAEFSAENFDKQKIEFYTQDFDCLFKTAQSFVRKMTYEGKEIELHWAKAEPIGNICLLCSYENGFLVPVYDAIKKVKAPERQAKS